MDFIPFPEKDLLQRLQNRSGAGTYEAHITVRTDSSDQCRRFVELCNTLQIKAVIIELPSGEVPTQLMSGSYHRGSIADVVHVVAELTGQIRQAGFPVIRLKVEAVASNAGVPDDDAIAALEPADNYFEFHAKLLLPATADLGTLGTLCERHHAHLSRNALKVDREGQSERFITQRVYRLGRTSAFARFDALLADLDRNGFVVVNRQREYTIFDSNTGIDAGWIDVEAAE